MDYLRVALDGTPLLGPRTGIGHYTANLCQALMQLEPALRLRLFYGASWSERFPDDKDTRTLQKAFFLTVKQAVRLLGPWVAIYRKRLMTYAERFYFHRGITNFQPHVVHGTNGCIHLSGVPTVITIHDISCFRHPETHPQARVEWQQRMFPTAIERAQRIITVSEFTRREVINYFGVSSTKITVTHNGVDPVFCPRAASDISAALRDLGLVPGSYLLTVGTLEPRKNLGTLIHAHSRLPKVLSNRYPLVLVGMRGWKESAFVQLLEPLVMRGDVRILGYVPQALLPAVYNGARAFAYPSIYEGFGLPPLEAMASGVPVAVSDVTSLPEVVGDAGLLVPPHDVEAWTQALQRLLLDEEYRSAAIRRGLSRARGFSWNQCADSTLQVYRELARQ